MERRFRVIGPGNSRIGWEECGTTKLTLLASWIAFPSASGSVKGTPSSITLAPPASIASIIGTVLAIVGKPAVRKVTKTGSF